MILWEQANAYFDRNEFDKALRCYMKVEKSPKVFFNMAIIQIIKKNYTKAMKTLTKIVHLRWGIVHFLIANCLVKMELFNEALIWYQRCLDEFKGYKEIDYFTMGLDTKLSTFDVLMNMFICYELANNEVKAREILLKAKRKYPGKLTGFPKRLSGIYTVFTAPNSEMVSPIAVTQAKLLPMPQTKEPIEESKSTSIELPIATSSPVFCK